MTNTAGDKDLIEDAGDASAAPFPMQGSKEAAQAHGSSSLLREHLVPLLLVFLVALATLLPGINTLPLTDRDEALYVQASRQMLESGDWVDIRFQNEPRYKKPVGIYWLQGLAAKTIGTGAGSALWVYRLPSLFGAILTAMLTYAIAAQMGGKRAGLLAGLLAAMTVELAFEARIGKTDAMLCATIVASQLGLLSAYLDENRRQRLWRNALFWLALGLGTLIKGPVAPMIAGFTLLGILATERNLSILRALSPVRGIIAYLCVVLPWLLAIGWISKGAFFQQSVGHDMLGKIATAQESHGAPPGTYILTSLGTFWPLSIFFSLAVWWAWKNRHTKTVAFLFFWIVPAWLLFELIATKLPNYILPMMPAWAVLAGLAVNDIGLKTSNRWFRFTYLGIAAGGVALPLALNLLFYHIEGHIHLIGLALGACAATLSILASVWFMRNRLRAGFTAVIVAVAAIYALGYGLLLPDARGLWLSDRIKEAFNRQTNCEKPVKLSIGYAEPSIVFRLGTPMQRLNAEDGAKAFHDAACAIAAVTSSQMPAFTAALATMGGSADPVELVTARNLNGLKIQSVQIVRKRLN
ncbi:ArnT family glycosyltransferase [Rhizobium helianthi]|uniref:ArnT family glycosyltransferase n=1 Tax=Rhizobium helianthi TaxID=1132695 RepID=A0ABW4M475_9HYPH